VNLQNGSDNNTIFYLTGTAINDQGTNNTLTSCSAVDFDYTNAPSAGCQVGIEEQAPQVELSVYPDPVKDQLMVSVGTGTTINEVRIVDMVGHEVGIYAGTANMVLNVSALQAGIYVVHVITDKGDVVRPIMKH